MLSDFDSLENVNQQVASRYGAHARLEGDAFVLEKLGRTVTVHIEDEAILERLDGFRQTGSALWPGMHVKDVVLTLLMVGIDETLHKLPVGASEIVFVDGDFKEVPR